MLPVDGGKTLLSNGKVRRVRGIERVGATAVIPFSIRGWTGPRSPHGEQQARALSVRGKT